MSESQLVQRATNAQNIELIPLEPTDLPPLAYPLDALPGLLGEMAEAVVEHVQCPAAIAGQSILGAASLAVQHTGDVLIDGRLFPSSIYALTVALSGERKTSADRLVLAEHQKWEREAWKDYEDALGEYALAMMRIKDAKKQQEKRWKTDSAGVSHMTKRGEPVDDEDEPQPPEVPQLISSDPTYQGIFRAFKSGRPSQGIFSDEGGTFLGGWGMKAENLAYTVSSLSRLWDGAPIQRTRGSDDIAAPLYGRRLACHLLITPAVADRNLNEFMIGQGFLPRFLIARPESRIGFREYRRTDPYDDRRCQQFWTRMRSLLDRGVARTEDGGCDTRALTLTDDAYDFYVQMYNQFEAAMRPGADLSEITAFASKAAENMARIAALFTLVADYEATEIGGDAIAAAARLMDKYYVPEALRFVTQAPEDGLIAKAQRLAIWMADQPAGTAITVRDICRNGPRSARKSATQVRELIARLVEHRYVTVVAPDTVTLTPEARAHVSDKR